MIIQIDGVGTKNKGAELMLYSILDQIEISEPNSKVFINSYSAKPSEIESTINLRKRFALMFGDYPNSIANKLGLNLSTLTTHKVIGDLDLVLDGSGFKFGDQWNHSKAYLSKLEAYYSKLHKNGTKVIMLPQAFGPFDTTSGKYCANILKSYCNLIIARDVISSGHLIKAGLNPKRIMVKSDFTNLVKGTFPNKYNQLKGGVCIIPSVKMITKTDLNEQEYLQYFVRLSSEITNKGKKPFLLNHEGKGDFDLCKKINQKLNNSLTIVNNLNAKQIKGIIGESYLTVSSRYHGVSNSLGQGVPCLATSWSHKYEMLFDDYNVERTILDISDINKSAEMVTYYIDESKNNERRNKLINSGTNLRKSINDMWINVWEVARN